MRTRDILRKTAKLLEEKGWTKYYYAVDKKGQPVPPLSSKAYSFCLVGALCRIVDKDPLSGFFGDCKKTKPIIKKLNVKVGELSNWNDDPKRTKEEVIKALRKAAR